VVAEAAALIGEGIQNVPVKLAALLLGRAVQPNSTAPDATIARLRAELRRVEDGVGLSISECELDSARDGLRGVSHDDLAVVDFLSITDLLVMERAHQIEGRKQAAPC
jgi:hypothetical protein